MDDEQPAQWGMRLTYFMCGGLFALILVVWLHPLLHLKWSPNALRPVCTDMAARIKMDHSVPLYVLLDVCGALRDIDLVLMPDMAAFNRVAALVEKDLRGKNERLRL
jgi:hypothetical protein